MRSKSSPTSRPSSASLPNVGDLVWARVGSFPWWPGRVVSRAQLSLAPAEPEPAVRPGQMLVQFFNDNNRYEVMDRKNVRTYHTQTADNVNKGYDGPYKYDLRQAIKEMTDYANEIAWEKNNTRYPNNLPDHVDLAKHPDLVAKPAVENTPPAPRGQKNPVATKHPSMPVDEKPTPVLTSVDDLRLAASMDAEDVEFVFKNNVDVVSDDGYLITGHTRAPTLDAPQIRPVAVDDDHDVIYLDRDPDNQGTIIAAQPQPKRDPPSAAHVRVAQEAVATPGRNVIPPNGPDAMQGVVAAAHTALVPSQPATAPSATIEAANGSSVPLTPRKEPHSDDTSTESLPINVSPANENDAPAELNGQGGAVEAQAGKRKMEQFEGVQTSTPAPVVTAKIGADAPRKRKKKNAEQQGGANKGKMMDTTIRPKSKSAVVAKSSVINGGGETRQLVNKGSRAARPKKSSKASSAGGSVAEKADSGSKVTMDVRSALRWRDEKIVAMQAQIDRLEGDDTGKTGQEMVRNGLELIQPAKEMLKSAQDMLKSAHEMIKEGQEMMKRSG